MENGKLYNYAETIRYMDYFLEHGSQFSLAWCMEMVNQVFAFVEEHGITSLVPVSHSEERRSDIV